MIWIWLGIVVIGAALFMRMRNRVSYPSPESLIIPPTERVTVTRDPDERYTLLSDTPPSAIYAGAQPDSIDRMTTLNVEYDRANNAWRIAPDGLSAVTRSYFEVQFADGTRRMVAERILNVEGVANFRDIGGYPTADGRHTRWGMVYRTGMLAELTEISRAYLRGLNVRWVCDLRSDEEIEAAPDRVMDNPAIRYEHKSLFAPNDTSRRLRALLFNKRLLPQMMQEMYTDVLIDANARAYGNILRDLAVPGNLPALIHCTAGKDRTGAAIMLLLLALGVAEDIVIADYSLSNRYFTTFRTYTVGLQRRLRWFGLSLDDITPMLVSNPDTLRATIAHLQTKYGGIEPYLRDAAGVDAATLAALRATLLE
ncbi:MAG: tyrosine-protein phosphatase [Chloroflexota bacterium]|nr:tyrosine-protein phosphatase [Chloroflexota bacterium]